MRTARFDLLSERTTCRALTRRAVLAQAWPVILGQTLIPLVGVIDTTVIGQTNTATTLAGVALGVTTINLVFWTFGFLRMGITGLAAQAEGAQDIDASRILLLRALLLSTALGFGLIISSPLIVPVALKLLHVPIRAAQAAHDFTTARFFGAPGALGFYVINGWLLGLNRTKVALLCQIGFNGLNIILNIFLVAGLGLGAWGAGIGTSIAEWSALVGGLVATRNIVGANRWRVAARDLFDGPAYRRLTMVNSDIMIRTIALLLITFWFARAGARLGPIALAANHILLQFVTVSSFVLDGFAFTAEARIGTAIGARSRSDVERAMRLTAELSLALGLIFSALIALMARDLLPLLTKDREVQKYALAMTNYCALIPTLGVASWLLDGFFLGATRTRVMRNATLLAAALYLATDISLRAIGEKGVWIALLASYVYRAITLGIHLPRLIRTVDQ